MGRTSIEWTDYTFNPWRGCFKISPGCKNCYADRFDARGLHGTERHWGETTPRAFQSDAYWQQPLRWNKKAELLKVRPRVFCASMADVFEDRWDLRHHRLRLFELIRSTPALEWLLLTKRPGNFSKLMSETIDAFPSSAYGLGATTDMVQRWQDGKPPPNVWIGTSVEDQPTADDRISKLIKIPAAVRFLSCEPLLEEIDLSEYLEDDGYESCGPQGYVSGGNPIDWVIVGGESGPGARPFDMKWARKIVAQCRRAGVQPFVKQMGASVFETHGEYQVVTQTDLDRHVEDFKTSTLHDLRNKKGKDMSEWPADLRVREFPTRRAF